MNIRPRILVLIAAVTMQVGIGMAAVDFSRYEVILQRKPFGEPPEAAGGPGGAPPPASFIKDIKLCAITDSDEYGIRVGFVDVAAKKNHYLAIGESEDGITVVDADYDKEAAKLQKGSESYWINMAGLSNAGGGEPPELAAAASAVPPDASMLTSRNTRRASTMASYAERRKKREAIRRAPDNMPPISPEDMEKSLQATQMDLIRAGGESGPPLPMPLTPEMDQQLVAEGVLPPLDAYGNEIPTPAPEAPPVEMPEMPPPDGQ